MNCDGCNSELVPDNCLPGAPTTYQFDNALWIEFHGGYGMFIDHDFCVNDDRIRSGKQTDAVQVVICHDCAHAACEAIPWLNGLLNPYISHSHKISDTDRLLAEGHRGWDLDREVQQRVEALLDKASPTIQPQQEDA